jgi:hypothetical protein
VELAPRRLRGDLGALAALPLDGDRHGQFSAGVSAGATRFHSRWLVACPQRLARGAGDARRSRRPAAAGRARRHREPSLQNPRRRQPQRGSGDGARRVRRAGGGGHPLGARLRPHHPRQRAVDGDPGGGGAGRPGRGQPGAAADPAAAS